MNGTVAAVAAAIAAAIAAPAFAGQATSPVLVDPHLTIGAGATITASVGEAIAHAESAVVPDRVFTERGTLRRSGNVAFRLLKFAFFDTPQERLVMVTNHEVFGHGARLRERFDGPIGYRIGLPHPYGRGGGSTSFVVDRDPSAYDTLAVNVAGMEASGVASGLIAHQAFSRDALRMRDSLRYLLFELDTLSYVLSTNAEEEEPGHDVTEFLGTYNALARQTGDSGLTVRALRSQALSSLANPMLGYAVYAIGRYVWSGMDGIGVPALSIRGVRYLPMLRYRLAPYGVEWSLTNEFGGRIRPTQIELRVGRTPHAEPWGIGLRQRELVTWRRWNVDAGVDLWRQPRMNEPVDPRTVASTRLGGQLRVRASRPLIPVWFSPVRAAIVVDTAVKTSGFVAGEPLNRGLLLRAGIGLPFGS